MTCAPKSIVRYSSGSLRSSFDRGNKKAEVVVATSAFVFTYFRVVSRNTTLKTCEIDPRRGRRFLKISAAAIYAAARAETAELRRIASHLAFARWPIFCTRPIFAR